MTTAQRQSLARHLPTAVEVLGPPGAGKSALVSSLCAKSDDVQAVSTYLSFSNLSPWLRSGTSLLPLPLPGRWPSVREWTWITRVDASLLILKRMDTRRPVAAFDQGPVFTLARIREGNAEAVNKSRFERWWQERISRWAKALDVVIVLDAPDEVLLQRIRKRSKPHHFKSRSEGEARERLANYRLITDDLIDQFEALDRVQVARVDTSLSTKTEVANKAMAALGLPTLGSKGAISYASRQTDRT